MTWSPSPEARAVGDSLQGAYPYVRGSATSAAEPRVQRPVGAGTATLAAFIRSRWSLASAGTVRAASMSSPAQRADGSWRNRDLHEDGRAIDAMTEADVAKGAQIANFLIVNAAALGVQYLVFDGLDWCVSTVGSAFEPIFTSQDRRAWGRAINMHRDHVHLELTPSMAADGEAMREVLGALTGEMPPPSRAAGRGPTAPSTRAPAEPPSPAPAAPGGVSTATAIVALFGIAAALDYARGRR